MSEPFIGQIMAFGGNFAPRSWALCDGQLLPISQNQALFSILGTTYGGDGRTSFGLPDLRGRVPIHAGNGPALSPRRLGERGGSENVNLTVSQLPPHNHQVHIVKAAGDRPSPNNKTLAATTPNNSYSTAAADGTMRQDVVGLTGGGQSHSAMQPFLAINFIIALQGTFPSRS